MAVQPYPMRSPTASRTGSVVMGALLLVSAYLLSTAIRSTDGAWFGWFALLPLFFAIRRYRPVGAALGAALWGAGLWLFLSQGAGAPIRAGGGTLALLVGVPAFYAFLGSWVTRWSAYSPLVLGVGWVAVELALQPLGLREGLLATTQGTGAWASWVAPTLGYAMVSFVVALVSASFVSALSVVRLTPPRPACRVNTGDGGQLLIPQTFSCLVRYTFFPSQPRAPPEATSR